MPTIMTNRLDYWVHCVSRYLSEKELSHRNGLIDRLISDNDTVLQQTKGLERHSGFLYNGLIWRTQDPPAVFFDRLPALDSSLESRMDDILAAAEAAQKDFIKIRQAVYLVLYPCNADAQNARDTLPDFMASMFPDRELSQLSRTREPLFTIEDNPSAQRLWAKVEDKIQYYAAMRLIYQ